MVSLKNNKIYGIIQNKNGFGATIGLVAAVLITILVCLIIYWNVSPVVSDNLHFIKGAKDNSTNVSMHRLTNSTNSSAGSIFTLAPVIGIVMIAGIILMIVTRFGQKPV